MVERVRAEDLTPARFFEEYLKPNTPVLIEGALPSSAFAGWATAEGRVDFAALDAFNQELLAQSLLLQQLFAVIQTAFPRSRE